MTKNVFWIRFLNSLEDTENTMPKVNDPGYHMSNIHSEATADYNPSVWSLAAYALGLMVMPDNLALAGQFAGQLGIIAPMILAAGVLIYFNYVNSFNSLYVISSSAGGQDIAGRTHVDIWMAYYALVVRILAAIFLATGLTVSSGFVFNEVFVYWFPNFAFAFILLAGLVGLQLLRKTYREKAQLIFVGIIFVGMAVLIAVGLVTSLFQGAVQFNEHPPIRLSGILLPLLLLLGFDMAIFPDGDTYNPSQANTKSLKSAIAIFAGFMILWIMTALLFVDEQRLAGTSIAHMIVAREIGGQTGRLLMGLMVIAGTCAAVNALFESVNRAMRNLLQTQTLTRIRSWPKITLLSVAAVAAFLMATGLAGEELLEILIRAILLMWLGLYGLITVQLIIQRQHLNDKVQRRTKNRSRFLLMFIAMVTFGAILMLTLTDTHTILIFTIMLVILGTVFAMGCVHGWYANRSS